MVTPRSATRDTMEAQGLGPPSALGGICRLSLLFVGGLVGDSKGIDAGEDDKVNDVF